MMLLDLIYWMISEIYEVIITYIHNRLHLDTCRYYIGLSANEVGLFGACRSISETDEFMSYGKILHGPSDMRCPFQMYSPFCFFQFKNDVPICFGHDIFTRCLSCISPVS